MNENKLKHLLKISTLRFLKNILYPLLLFFISCSPAKYVPKENYLLSKNKIKIEQGKIEKSKLKNYIRQQPNKKILGFRLNLALYNISNLSKTKWPHGWLRKIGEEPVIFDPFLTKQTVSQLEKYLETKGYYNAIVKDTTVYRGKRNAKVYYSINPKEPYCIRNIYYLFEDTSLMTIVLNDTINSLITKGMLFDKDVLQEERIRIEDVLKQNGYFRFSKEYIYYTAEVIPEINKIDLTLGIKEFIEGEVDRKSKVRHHKKYGIHNVTIYPDFTAYEAFSQPLKENNPDTFKYNNIKFIVNQKKKIKPSVISSHNYINPGQIYNYNNVDKTYRNLSSLGLFKFVNVQFSEPKNQNQETFGLNPLDCKIELTRNKVQSYEVEFVGTNSYGDLGVRSNLLYKNLNLFRGAEIFNFKLTGAIEALKDSLYSRSVVFGTEFRIEIPKFLLPLRSQEFVKKYSPKTFFSLALNHRAEKKYVKTYASAAIGYTWKGNRHLRHSVYPLELNFVQVDEEKSKDILEDSTYIYLWPSFTDHMVGVSRYAVEYNNQEIGKAKDFMYFKMNLETSGNLLFALSKLTNRSTNNEGNYLFFEVPFSQYLRSDFDFRYYRVFDAKNSLVYRIFFGLAYPYGNLKSVPYEKKYFVGGPNSVRAWNAYTLGPGSYNDTTSNKVLRKYKNPGDIKLELNLEYRFKLFWKLEGALFMDAGNIWDIYKQDERPNAFFEWNRFFKELAIGTGFGTRFDFPYILLRIDLGMKVKDPSLPQGKRFVFLDQNYKGKLFTLQFGIDYPF